MSLYFQLVSGLTSRMLKRLALITSSATGYLREIIRILAYIKLMLIVLYNEYPKDMPHAVTC